ncbi:hypothetical protein QFC21_005647 [Naganishia friedmannii]|uniref:Uncharacterized protein n=1 Tax=Naganishia friedmannii TaxID=89922 RepID=A0ACC2V8T6_9TREE|nr:hypothetical protein QFC21_005647 [Naganishia friedmannii]
MSLKRKQWMETPSPSRPSLSNQAGTPGSSSSKTSPTKLVSTPGHSASSHTAREGDARGQGTPGTPGRDKDRENRKKMKMELPGGGGSAPVCALPRCLLARSTGKEVTRASEAEAKREKYEFQCLRFFNE